MDSELEAFQFPAMKREKFADLRELKKVAVKMLQRFQGKCVSFSIEVPAPKHYIRNICGAVASAHGSLEVNLSDSLQE